MRVGLTGGIASGKSTVAAMLVELGAVLIDGDALAREVVARGTPGLAQVVEEFGEGILTPEGDLDRPALGAIVFAEETARRRLEAITHPLIFERYADKIYQFLPTADGSVQVRLCHDRAHETDYGN